jgi:hypothetical protein
MTPLMIAVGMRATGRGGGVSDPVRTGRIVDLLLDSGANINAQVTGSRNKSGTIMAYVAGRDQEGKTALMSAAESGNPQVVQHLLERGADPMLKDAEGKTALDFAKAPPPAAQGGQAAAAANAAAAPAAAAGRAAAAAPAAGAAPAGGARGGGGGAANNRAQVVQLLEAAMAKKGAAPAAAPVAATPAATPAK